MAYESNTGRFGPKPYNSGARKPAFEPKGDAMTIPQQGGGGTFRGGGATGSWGSGSPTADADPSANVSRMGGGGGGNLYPTDYSWMNFQPTTEAEYAAGRNTATSNDLADAENLPATNPNWPWGPDQGKGGIGPGRTSTGGGGGSNRGPTGSSFQGQQVVQPFEAMKAPELPEYEGIGEYKPPEETDDAYNKARQGSMNAGVREMRDQARESMSTAQSLDNPNARAKFVQQALKGYGQGLSKVAQAAGKEGRTEASRSRSEELQTYRTNYDIKSDAYLKNYQNEINQIATDFASGQAANVQNYNAGLNPNVTVAGQGGGTPYGPNKTAPSKSMQKYGFEVLYS